MKIFNFIKRGKIPTNEVKIYDLTIQVNVTPKITSGCSEHYIIYKINNIAKNDFPRYAMIHMFLEKLRKHFQDSISVKIFDQSSNGLANHYSKFWNPENV